MFKLAGFIKSRISHRVELFKFGVYVGAPILTIMYFNRPDFYHAYLEKKQLIVYPPEGERVPDTFEGLLERKRELDAEDAAAVAAQQARRTSAAQATSNAAAAPRT